MLVHVSVELDIDCDVVSGKLPGIEVQPVIWDFNLVAIHNFLLEYAVFVSQGITPGWVVHGGQAIEEAGGETSKTAVTEGSIVFLRDDIFNSKAQLRQAVCGPMSKMLVAGGWYCSYLGQHPSSQH